VCFALLVVVSAGVSAAAQAPRVAVRGTVRDSVGSAVVGAQVSVAGATNTTVTNDDGAFLLPDVAAGKIQLLVRRLGFRPASANAEVSPDHAAPVKITMSAVPSVLQAVAIRARREPFESRLSGFNARRTKGIGYFITRQQIERTPNSSVIDALRGVAGVRVVTLRGAMGRSVSLGGASCPPLVFLDGFPATAGPFDLDGLELGSLEGVEIYSGFGVPPELIGPHGPDRCGVIAVWSAPARPRTSSSEQGGVDVAKLVSSGEVFTAEQVDTPAVYEEGTATALYPEVLTQSHIHGRVVVDLVVDAEGDVEPGTISVVTTTNAAFSVPAMVAASRAHFVPATASGKRVRQLVQLPFDFDPTAPVATQP
jgi:TonB family protein